MCQGFGIFSAFVHYFELAKLATGSIRVNGINIFEESSQLVSEEAIF